MDIKNTHENSVEDNKGYNQVEDEILHPDEGEGADEDE